MKKALPTGTETAPRISGAIVHDRESGQDIEVHAKVVVNATGCFTDGILQMDEPGRANVVVASKGLHVMLPSYFCPP